MNKFWLTVIILIPMCLVTAFGQDVSLSPVSDVTALQQAVRQQSEATQTLSSHFVQEKYLDMLQDVLLSNGRFMYKKENSVRWEYTDPIRYTILIHDGKFTIDNEGKISEFSTQSNPMFREINKMIVTAIRGDFVDSPDFSPTYFENEKQVMARLVPASAQVRSMIEHIEIYFQKSDMQVVKVLQNAVSRMLQVADKSIFSDNVFVKEDKSFRETLDLIGRISEMINAATDNDSLGGALGKIGFTSYTSQIISGMILHGKSLEEIIAVTTSDRFVNLENRYKRNRFNGNESRSSLKKLIEEKNTLSAIKELTQEQQKALDDLNDLIEYNIAGEKIRRYASIIGLQQGIKGTSWGIYSKIQQIETVLGQSLESFSQGELSDVAKQMVYLAASKKNEAEMKSDSDVEMLVRDNGKAFDLQKLIKATPQLDAYIKILNATNKIAEEAFSVTPNTPFVKAVLEKSGTRTVFTEKVYKAMMSEATKVSLATFLHETYGTVEMNGSSYNMSSPSEKSQFVIDFVDYIETMRNDPYNKLNAFFAGSSQLKKKQFQGDIPIYNIHASNGASKETLMNLKENGFELLRPNDKKLFRIYNLLVYGLSRKDGNMTGVIDNVIEKQYSDWLGTTKDMFGGINPIEVLPRVPSLVNQRGTEYYSYVRGGYSILGVDLGYKENKKVYMPFSSPYSSMINTYPVDGVKTYQQRNVFNGITLKDLDSLELGVETKIASFNHGVQRGNRNTSMKNKTGNIYSGETVSLRDGSTAKVVREGRNAVKITLLSRPNKVSNAVQTHRPSETRDISSNQAESLVNYMVSSLNNLFPNLNVLIVDNESTNLPGNASWIGGDATGWAKLDWLASILLERYEYRFSLELNDGILLLRLDGEEGQIEFDTLEPSFGKSASNMASAEWDADAEGWHSVLGVALPTPGVAELPFPLIEGRSGGYIIHYDILGLAYWALSRLEEVGRTDLDEHGRFPATSSHAFKYGYLERPVVDEWLHILGQVITRQWPGIELKRHQFSIKVSHDVDIPSRFAFASPVQIVRRLGCDILRHKNFSAIYRSIMAKASSSKRIHRSDPLNTFEWIMDTSDRHGLGSAFYFLCGRTDSTKDADYEIEHSAMRSLLLSIHKRGHEVGLHPSYGTYQKPNLIVAEAERLRRICAENSIEQNQWGGRMHYLRWEQPTTMLGWECASMTYDSTLSYADHAGFRCGTCFEYPAFEPVSGRALNLRIRPLIAMECTVMGDRYMGLNGDSAAFEVFAKLKHACKIVNGCYTLLWHNSNLEHKSEKELYRAVLNA